MRRDSIVTVPTGEWFVLDGRAPMCVTTKTFVPGDAPCLVLEACGRKRPNMKALSKDWGQQGAWLAKDAGQLGFELVEEIP